MPRRFSSPRGRPKNVDIAKASIAIDLGSERLPLLSGLVHVGITLMTGIILRRSIPVE
jgi:hypothetical protein